MPAAVADAPVADAPVADAPVADAPVVEAPVAAAPKAKPAPAPAPIVIADIASSGLEMVETKAAAIPAVTEDAPTPKRKAGPAPWQKKAAEDKAAEEPLVMVETQK